MPNVSASVVSQVAPLVRRKLSLATIIKRLSPTIAEAAIIDAHDSVQMEQLDAWLTNNDPYAYAA